MEKGTGTFSIGSVISAYTGYLVTETGGIDDVYKILSFLFGTQVFTHHIPSLITRCREPLLEQCPWLAELDGHRIYHGTREDIDARVAEFGDKHGHIITLRPFSASKT